MAKVFGLNSNTLQYNFLTAVMTVDPYTWRRTRNPDGSMIETFELVSDANNLTDSQIIAAIQYLDEMAELVRIYYESDKSQNPVWFHLSADTETAKRALVTKLDVIPKNENFFSPMLGEGLHYFSCQITHTGVWESITATLKENAWSGSTWTVMSGESMSLQTIPGSLPGRIEKIIFYDIANNSLITEVWAGIKPRRNGIDVQAFLEMEAGYTVTSGVSRNPDYLIWQYGSTYTDLPLAIDDNTGTHEHIYFQYYYSNFLYIGSTERFSGVYMNLGTAVNNNVTTISVKYSNGQNYGTDWSNATIATIDGDNGDYTRVGGAPLAQDGYIIWNTIGADWVQQAVDGHTCYWIRIGYPVALDDVELLELDIYTTLAYLDNEGEGCSPDETTNPNSILWIPAYDEFQEIFRSTLNTMSSGTMLDYIGRWLVLLRYRFTEDGEVRLRLRYGQHVTNILSGELEQMAECEDIYIDYDTYSDTNFHLTELGEISVPAFNLRDGSSITGGLEDYALELKGEKIGGAGSFRMILDAIILIPSEHMVIGRDLQLLPDGYFIAGELEDGSQQHLQYLFHPAYKPYLSNANAAIINFSYPIEGGILICAGQRATGHVLTDALHVSLSYYTRHRNFYDTST